MKDIHQITLVSFGATEKKFLNRLGEAIRLTFHTIIILKEERLDLNNFFDAARRQYNGNELLKIVDSMFSEHEKVIGIFNVDLFIPILTFIYGQAMLNGRTGVVSVYRLDNQRYGLKKDEELLFQRTLKEIIHELGHSFGLIHCHTPNCVMRSSTYVEDIDQKNSNFCKACLYQLDNHFASLN